MKFPTSKNSKPDKIEELIIKALDKRPDMIFTDLYDDIEPAMRELFPTAGAETMRLRSYELLQKMAVRGKVNKNGKQYRLP